MFGFGSKKKYNVEATSSGLSDKESNPWVVNLEPLSKRDAQEMAEYRNAYYGNSGPFVRIHHRVVEANGDDD